MSCNGRFEQHDRRIKDLGARIYERNSHVDDLELRMRRIEARLGLPHDLTIDERDALGRIDGPWRVRMGEK